LLGLLLRRAKEHWRSDLPEGQDDLLLLNLSQLLIGEEDLGILDPDPNDRYLNGFRLPRRVEVGQPQPPAALSSDAPIVSDRLAAPPLLIGRLRPVDKATDPSRPQPVDSVPQEVPRRRPRRTCQVVRGSCGR
jgi:hypothetical protein